MQTFMTAVVAGLERCDRPLVDDIQTAHDLEDTPERMMNRFRGTAERHGLDASKVVP